MSKLIKKGDTFKTDFGKYLFIGIDETAPPSETYTIQCIEPALWRLDSDTHLRKEFEANGVIETFGTEKEWFNQRNLNMI